MRFYLRDLSIRARNLLIISLVLALGVWAYLCDKSLTFSLVGDEEVYLDVFSHYADIGVNAYVCSFFRCKDLNDSVVIWSNVDVDKVGDYTVFYDLSYKDKYYRVERKVVIKDEEKPVIELVGDKDIYLSVRDFYTEEGFSAYDNYDGDLTDEVKKEVLDEAIIYEVSDKAGNKTEVRRNLHYEEVTTSKTKKVMLRGSSVIYLEVGQDYVDEGVFVNSDTLNVTAKGEVDTSKVGSYDINYFITDLNGDTTILVRTVCVYDLFTDNVLDYQKSLSYYFQMMRYKVSVGYVSLDSDSSYYYNENKTYYGASLIKTVDALYVYEKMSLNDNLKNLVKESISVSSNSAHEALLKKIGVGKLERYAKELGLENVAINSYGYAKTNVVDQIKLWKYLDKFIKENQNGEELKAYFINYKSNYLLLDNGYTVMHKYGYSGKVFHDVGIVMDEKPYIIVVLTEEGEGNFREIIQDVSKKISYLNQIIKKD